MSYTSVAPTALFWTVHPQPSKTHPWQVATGPPLNLCGSNTKWNFILYLTVKSAVAIMGSVNCVCYFESGKAMIFCYGLTTFNWKQVYINISEVIEEPSLEKPNTSTVESQCLSGFDCSPRRQVRVSIKWTYIYCFFNIFGSVSPFSFKFQWQDSKSLGCRVKTVRSDVLPTQWSGIIIKLLQD